MAQWLIRRHRLQPEAQTPALLGPGTVPKDERRALSPESFIGTILILMFCLGVGGLLAEHLIIPRHHPAHLRLVPAGWHRRRATP